MAIWPGLMSSSVHSEYITILCQSSVHDYVANSDAQMGEDDNTRVGGLVLRIVCVHNLQRVPAEILGTEGGGAAGRGRGRARRESQGL